MIRDANAMLLNNVSIAAAAGTAAAGSIYDTAAQSPSAVSSIFDSEDLFLVIRVRVAIIGATSGTVQFQLVSAATTTITSSPNVHWASHLFVTGTTGTGPTAIGAVLACLQVPRGANVNPAYLRYIGILVVTAGQTTTAGSVDAFLTKDAGFWAAIPEAAQ